MIPVDGTERPLAALIRGSLWLTSLPLIICNPFTPFCLPFCMSASNLGKSSIVGMTINFPQLL
jgi:hypothetical protein